MTDWLWPLLGGLLTAAAAGPLGSLLLWRRMAYFGDSLAHASLFGVALALMLHLPAGIMIVATCLLVALLLSRLMSLPEHGGDTWLAIMAYAGLSLSLVLTALHERGHGHDDHAGEAAHGAGDDHGHALEDYLFGNLLALDGDTLLAMAAGLLVVGIVLARTWPGLVAMAIHEESAQVDGWPVARLRPLLLLLLAGVVAAGAKVMGVLLISALLVIPAAAARYLARSPGQMALRASLIGMLAVAAGVGIGVPGELPVAALTVLAALLVLLAAMGWRRLRG
ncbi:metal ABC transporter permease [Amnimonas aquatica]|nr:metal ABC transporter permease [Amnimonas aquatica]